MTAWTTGSVSSGGEEIYYETAGEGDAVVFGHGLGGNHAVWYQQVPVFADSFRAVTWDQRDFGRSTDRNGQAGPATATDDLVALLDHLQIGRAHLVGQSMGGWAVLGAALRAPDRVRSLVITDSTAGVMTDAIAEIVARRTRASLPEPVIGKHPAIGASLDPVKTFLYQEIGAFRGDVKDADMVMQLYTTTYPSEAIAALDIPALLIVGASDDLIPPAAVHEMKDVFRHARVVEIEGAGHSPYFERPDEWNSTVLGFLAEQ
jgi:pimeloyl-ACP methyl ester carboxylesterase